MAQAAGRRADVVGRALCIGVGADADARIFAALVSGRGFREPLVLLGEEATRAAVRAKLTEFAGLSEPGDLFVLTFSGHGGRTRLRGQGDELRDVRTWQLYDGVLNDEQLTEDLARFRQGVRVVVVCDNCGGGMPAAAHPDELNSSVLVFAACEAGKYADGAGLPGHFAGALSRTLSGFDGSYGELHGALCGAMPSYQQPDYYRLGMPDAAFEAQRPFATR